MRWEDNRESDNVEDRRDDSGGGGGMGFGGIHLGLGGIILVLVGSWLFGVNPMTVLGLLSGGGSVTAPAPSQPARQPPANDPLARFVSTILASTEDVWGEIFAQSGRTYERPRLVLFRGAIPTACGTGQSAMGPFYCPQDRKVYIDLGFYQTLRNQLGSPGDFAQAYVIAHEVGHHVQNLLGTTAKVDALRARESRAQANATSVRVELQADCYAGVWAFIRRPKNTGSTRAISNPRSTPPRTSATTHCNDRNRGAWCRKPSPTAPARSASAGSSAALPTDASRTATLSPRDAVSARCV
jgi:predicted metalloprotease